MLRLSMISLTETSVLPKFSMAFVKVLHDGFFKFAASPSTVADQNNDGSDKRLLV